MSFMSNHIMSFISNHVMSFMSNHVMSFMSRQATSRSFPPQHEKSSQVSRLVETWEKLPVHVQGEEKQSVVKKKIKSWASKYVQ
jgi:hypothetical protein